MHPLVSDLIDETTVCRVLGGEETPIHPCTLRRWINARGFPKPLKIGPGTNRWRASEVAQYLEKAASERALMIGRAS